MNGSWVTTHRPAYETEIRSCEACGAMIADTAFVSNPAGRILCGPQCEELEERVSRLRSLYSTDADAFASLEASISNRHG